jgi:hypothetical protein
LTRGIASFFSGSSALAGDGVATRIIADVATQQRGDTAS